MTARSFSCEKTDAVDARESEIREKTSTRSTRDHNYQNLDDETRILDARNFETREKVALSTLKSDRGEENPTLPHPIL